MTLVLLLSTACAEDLAIDRLNQHGFDAVAFFQRIISGESLTTFMQPGRLMDIIRQGVRYSVSVMAANLALPTLACVLVRTVVRRSDTDFMMSLLCALCCGTALIEAWLDAQRDAIALIDGLLQATETMTPVLASAAALAGGAFFASGIAPLASLCAGFLQQLLRDWAMRLCACAVFIALSGAVAGEYALNRLFALLKGAARWLLGGAVFIFGALISAQGLVGAARDGAAVQTARAAIESVVPIIGSGVSDATGALVVSANLARGAIGITGAALIAKICLEPLLRIGSRTLALKLIAAAMEPVAEGATARLIGQFGDILETLLAIAVCAAVLSAMLPASLAISFGRLLG